MNKRTPPVFLIIICVLFLTGCGTSDAGTATIPDAQLTQPPIPPTFTPLPSPSPTPPLEGWYSVETETYPPPRSEAAMTVMSDGRVLLFGGIDENGNALNDTWIFGPDENAQGLTPDKASLASLASLGWLPGRIAKALIQQTPPSYLTNTWSSFDSSSIDTFRPSPAFAPSMTNCFWDDLSLLYGGQNDSGEYSSDMYMFDGTSWTKLEYTNTPPPGRSNANIWCDDNILYVLGGIGYAGILWDFWGLNYDANTFTFTWEAMPPAPEGSFSPFFYTSVWDGKTFIIDPHWFQINQGNMIYYNWETGTWEWSQMQNYPSGSPYAAAGIQVGDVFHLISGEYDLSNSNNWEPAPYHWVYSFSSSSWTQMEDTPWTFSKAAWSYAEAANLAIFFGGLNENEQHNSGNVTWLYYVPPPPDG